MIPLRLSHNATADLRALKSVHLVAAQKIAVIISEMKNNPEIQDRLTEQGWRDEDYHVDKWMKEARNNRCVFRIKVWKGDNDLAIYRIVYCLIPVNAGNRTPYFYVLAVANRNEFSYGEREDDQISKRIIADFDAAMDGFY